MPYSHTTLQQLRVALVDRLSAATFWDQAGEADAYLKEALRVWGAYSLRWRKRVTFQLDQDVQWYDLTSKIADLTPTVKDQDLIAEMQLHLLEQVDGTFWVETEQFAASEPPANLELRRDQFLSETGLILTRDTPATISLGATGRVNFAAVTALQEVIDVRRLVWRTAAGIRRNLWRTDDWGAHSFRPEWNLEPAETPDAFAQSMAPPLELQLIPPPAAPGLLEYITVKAGANLNITTGVLMGIPDALAWIVKYGALEDLLRKDGPGRDVPRADYCKQRWEQGLEVAKVYPMALEAELDGRRVPIGNVQELDAYHPDWESVASGTPERCALMGLNLFCVTPPPDSNAHSVTLDIVQPAPFPASDSAAVQIGKDEIDVILDYALHLASFKMGGAEFSETMPHYQNLVQLAAVYNEKLRTIAKDFTATHERAQEEARRRPVRTKPGA